MFGLTLTFVSLHGGPPNDGFMSLAPDSPPRTMPACQSPVIVEAIPAGTPRTTAATPSSPLAYTDDVISSYIGQSDA